MKAKRYAARLMADTGKLSQREIAAQLGVNQSTVSKWLQASRSASQRADA
ncbi:MAG: helix-turn-helix domain-containing protein [Thermoplasmata archaeon]